MDQPKLERLLRLMMLLTNNNSYNVDDLASKLDMSRRTIYRYIDTFRSAGFAIKQSGEFYKLDKSSPYFKDISELVHFTDEEAWILKSAIESIDETNIVKQNLRRKLYSIYDYKVVADCVVKGKNAKIVSKLIDAIDNSQSVVLHNYSSSNSANVSDRAIEPFAFTTNYIQVWGYEASSDSCKLYNISRIGGLELAGVWQHAIKHKAGFIDIFRISSTKQFAVTLSLGTLSRNLLIEEYPLSEAYLKKSDSNRWLLSVNVCGMQGVGRFVMGLLDDIIIIDSVELKSYVASKAKLVR